MNPTHRQPERLVFVRFERLIAPRSIAVLAAVGAFQSWAAARYTVFDDEAFSCLRYTMPLPEMLSALWRGVEPDPPLYYLLQNAWVRIVGVGPLGLRTLSICMFLIGLLVIRVAGREWFGERSGRAALILSAVHPAHLFLGFAARWYSAMFLAVAVLLWMTAKLLDGRAAFDTDAKPAQLNAQTFNGAFRRLAAWSVAAAAVCYTNYFGVVVVALVWILVAMRHGASKQWAAAGVAAVVLYAPWLPAFWRQATSFPSTGGGWFPYLATAGRTSMALLAGHLADPAAWWVWLAMIGFGVCATALAVRRWRRIRLIALLTIGCLAAGVASRTMIDKYVMAFSGAACLLAAGLLVREEFVGGSRSAARGDAPASGPRSQSDGARRAAVMFLAAGWIGCGFNLLTGRHWSSLRWLDPTETAIAQAAGSGVEPTAWVITHPAARYYAALHLAAMADADDAWRVASDRWRRQVERLPTPSSILKTLEAGAAPAVLTLETAGSAGDADWERLHAVLRAGYAVAGEWRFLEDPIAVMKDRIDPGFRHPRWRIVLRQWRRSAGAP